MKATGVITLRDRFRGCLLGLAVGDAAGAPFEGLAAETIYRDFPPTNELVANPPLDVLTYTDDTQMTLGVAECLVADGRIDPDRLMQHFASNYEAGRGYGSGLRRILDAMTAQQEWKYLVETLFPGGSFGNGAAMRVAPVGLLFHDDPDRLRQEARQSALATHLHPLGVDGAVVVATAVSIALRESVLNSEAFYDELSKAAETEEFQWQLRTARRMGRDNMMSFGSSLAAHRSVTTAITCFAMWPDSYENTISRAITMGDDTDTLAAIAGALSGARLGVQGIPQQLLNILENGPKGRDYIVQVADNLYARWSDSTTRVGSGQTQ